MLIMLWGDLAAKGVGTGFKDVKAYFKARCVCSNNAALGGGNAHR